MTKRTEVTCDGCGADLTSTENREAYRLGLYNEELPVVSRSGVVTCMASYTAIPHSHHFCDLRCLRKWLEKSEAKS